MDELSRNDYPTETYLPVVTSRNWEGNDKTDLIECLTRKLCDDFNHTTTQHATYSILVYAPITLVDCYGLLLLHRRYRCVTSHCKSN
jgi:uncharacterized membrane protein (DUF2068 family)